MLGSLNQITQMQAPTGPGSPAYVGNGSTQATPAALAAPASTSPLLAALIGAQNTQGQQTQTGVGGSLPIGALAQMIGQQGGQQNGFSGAQNLGLTQMAPSYFSEYSQPIGPGMAGSPS